MGPSAKTERVARPDRRALARMMVACLGGLGLVAAERVARAQAPGATGDSPPAVPEAARRAALAWLVQLDEVRYEASWEKAAGLFRDRITAMAWSRAMQTVRGPMGATLKRSERSATAATTMPGAPDGRYVTWVFDTTFEKKSRGVETVILMLEADGQWRTVGYFLH